MVYYELKVVSNVAMKLILCLLALLFVHKASAQERFRETHAAMGTIFTLDVYANDESAATQLAEDAFDVIDRVDDELSNYKPASELSRISRDAGSAAVTTDPETFAFLKRSVYWSRESHGAFDITVGPLLRAWGFFFHSGRVPTQTELLALRKDLGWQNIVLDDASRIVRFRNGKPMDLDPGSIGKGFAVDLAVERLRADGATAALLSAGGSTVYAIGAPPGEDGWPVLVPDPFHPGEVASRVLLKDTSLSTGACTEKFFIRDGHRYCHIFDPQRMRPVEGMLQTTVIDPSATDSDALSTVAFVLSPDQSRGFFSRLPKTRLVLFAQSSSGPRCLAVHWLDSPCGGTLPASRKQETTHGVNH
ncbi:MAG TPA: FAD:protein FMN transferase [Acidobacteriaceae bacterium]|jgi:thiamine biosynthesis lipoprotein